MHFHFTYPNSHYETYNESRDTEMYIQVNTKVRSSDTKTLGICYAPILLCMGDI